MNMYKHELSAYRKSLFGWISALVGISILMMSMFPTFSKDAGAFVALLSNMPDAVLAAMGIHMETITSVLGFYGYIFVYILLGGAIQAMLLGTSILSKEIREKTADFLLTKPVTRQAIVSSKLLAALTSLAVTNIIYMAAACLITVLVSESAFSLKLLILATLPLFFVQLIFFATGLLVSVIWPKMRTVLPVSLGVVFAFFLIGALGATTGDDKLRLLTPFKYFDTSYIVEHASYESLYIFITIAWVILATALSYIIYMKRDAHAV